MNGKRHISQIVLDHKGGDYADLPDRLGSHWLHFSVHEGMRIGIGSPIVPRGTWTNLVSTIFAARAGLIAAWTCLAKMINWLAVTMNPTCPNHPRLWPSFQLLLDVVRAAPLTLWAAKPDYGKSLIQALECVVQAAGGLFAAFRGLA